MQFFKYFRYVFCFIVLLLTACQQPSVTKVTIMTFNIENGGTQVDFNKVVAAVRKANADVVGIQEAWGNTARLASSLGWKYYDQRQHIISRFPLYEALDSHGTYLYVEVLPKKMIAMANLHLPDDAYYTDQIKLGKTAGEIELSEKQARLPTAQPVIDKLAVLSRQGVPVFLTGDFNSPSHLDWSKATVGRLPNHGQVIVWPVSRYAQNQGLIDSYRAQFPNPIQNPGTTWPASRPFLQNNIDHFNPGKDDLPERLDFIYSAGHSRVVASEIIGEEKVKPWPSDHRGVMSQFIVKPFSITMNQVTPILPNNHPQEKPIITVSKNIVRPGEVINISWQHAPGNGYDYIMIAPKNSTKIAWGEAVRLYTHAETGGTIQYGPQNIKGNWLAWYKGEEGKWPLNRGVYELKLMLDDGYTVLATTEVTVR